MPGTRPGMTQSDRSRRAGSALHAHRDAHPATDTECGEALLGVALLHFEEQRCEHARAGRADRMADRDGAAVHVDLRSVPTEILVHGAGLRRKGLVRLDEIEIADIP